jgi:hypothetical protein
MIIRPRARSPLTADPVRAQPYSTCTGGSACADGNLRSLAQSLGSHGNLANPNAVVNVLPTMFPNHRDVRGCSSHRCRACAGST